MKPAPFAYAAPGSLEEAFDLLADAGDDARVIAGGQSLVPLMAFRLAQPGLLVDLRRVAELREVRAAAEGVAVGAMVTQAAAAGIEELHPLVREALPLIAHPQIRNRGTVGGSLAHADPAAELPAVAVALGAEMEVVSRDGERRVPADGFFVSYFTTTLGPGEVLRAVRFPPPRPQEGWSIREVARRPGDFALAGVATRVQLDEDGEVRDLAMVAFSVADRPRALDAARDLLLGRAPSPETLAEAVTAATDSVEPPSDVHASADYRRRAVRVLAERALATAVARAEGPT